MGAHARPGDAGCRRPRDAHGGRVPRRHGAQGRRHAPGRHGGPRRLHPRHRRPGRAGLCGGRDPGPYPGGEPCRLRHRRPRGRDHHDRPGLERAGRPEHRGPPAFSRLRHLHRRPEAGAPRRRGRRLHRPPHGAARPGPHRHRCARLPEPARHRIGRRRRPALRQSRRGPGLERRRHRLHARPRRADPRRHRAPACRGLAARPDPVAGGPGRRPHPRAQQALGHHQRPHGDGRAGRHAEGGEPGLAAQPRMGAGDPAVAALPRHRRSRRPCRDPAGARTAWRAARW